MLLIVLLSVSKPRRRTYFPSETGGELPNRRSKKDKKGRCYHFVKNDQSGSF